MGKIIRNGVEYSGAVDAATAVSYDGSVSGLKAQTVQEAIDELSAAGYTWELLGTSTSTSATNQLTIQDLSQYKSIALFASTDNDYVSPVILPTELFRTCPRLSALTAKVSNNYEVPVRAKYVSETSVYLWTGDSAYTANLYGIKSVAVGGSGNGSSESLEWKLAGKIVGKTSIALPNNFNELSIKLQNGDREHLFVTVPKIQLSEDKINCITGYSLSSGDTFVEYNLSVSEFELVGSSRINTDTTSTSSAEIWYR